MSITKYIREYIAIYYDDNNYVAMLVYGMYEDQKTFSRIPTKEELEVLFGASGFIIDVSDCFEDCASMIASPKLPEEVRDGSSFTGISESFMNCTSLVIPPKIPGPEYGYRTFQNCTALKQAPVIQSGAKYYQYFFRYCSSLAAPASIPATLKYFRSIYEECTAMAGELVVRGTPSSYTDALKNTVGNIIIYGDRSVCESVAATANNGNASWQPWYDPVPAVTNRGPGSYTTAADITRMVRNGALAVNTYAPGRMVYQHGDIVREDEWNALVEAAQTIDPTVTYSTHYANLNKIEAAFDSAL